MTNPIQKTIERQREEKEWDAGFPFGKTTIKELIRRCMLHQEKPFSEVFEFYTGENAEGAISERLAQSQYELLESFLEVVGEDYETGAEKQGVIGTHYRELEYKRGYNTAKAEIRTKIGEAITEIENL